MATHIAFLYGNWNFIGKMKKKNDTDLQVINNKFCSHSWLYELLQLASNQVELKSGLIVLDPSNSKTKKQQTKKNLTN